MSDIDFITPDHSRKNKESQEVSHEEIDYTRGQRIDKKNAEDFLHAPQSKNTQPPSAPKRVTIPRSGFFRKFLKRLKVDRSHQQTSSISSPVPITRTQHAEEKIVSSPPSPHSLSSPLLSHSSISSHIFSTPQPDAEISLKGFEKWRQKNSNVAMSKENMHTPKLTQTPVHSTLSSTSIIPPTTTGQPTIHHASVNLLPQQEKKREKKIHTPVSQFIFISTLTLACVLAVDIAFAWYQNMQTKKVITVQQEIHSTQEKIESLRDLQDRTSSIAAQLTAFANQIDQHISWSPFFTFLEAQTLPTVYYRLMSGSPSTGIFTFDAVATDYANVKAQVEVLKKQPIIQKASVSNVGVMQQISGSTTDDTKESTSISGIPFRLELTVDSSLFHTSPL